MGLICRFKRNQVAATMKDYVGLPEGDEDAMKEALATKGPVCVGIDASLVTFQNYRSGVYDDPKCTDQLNHAVLVTGYGTTADGKKYWIVKNSWGESWGNKGYIWMARGTNHCGIADAASYPVV